MVPGWLAGIDSDIAIDAQTCLVRATELHCGMPDPARPASEPEAIPSIAVECAEQDWAGRARARIRDERSAEIHLDRRAAKTQDRAGSDRPRSAAANGQACLDEVLDAGVRQA